MMDFSSGNALPEGSPSAGGASMPDMASPSAAVDQTSPASSGSGSGSGSAAADLPSTASSLSTRQVAASGAAASCEGDRVTLSLPAGLAQLIADALIAYAARPAGGLQSQ